MQRATQRQRYDGSEEDTMPPRFAKVHHISSIGERCYACGRKLGAHASLVDTRDSQIVFVGKECFKLIRAAGESGYQPPLGGPRLYVLKEKQ